MSTHQSDIDERTNLAGSNKFEMLMFRLGKDKTLGQSELFGINVFKIREIMAMPQITPVVGADPSSLGVLNLRGQVIPVFDLPAITAQAEVPALQGLQRTWFCGAWTGYGFHEDGLQSGYRAADLLLEQMFRAKAA